MKRFAKTVSRGAAIIVVAVVLASGCSKKSAPDVLARVGGQVITVADFQAEMQRRSANRQPLPDRQALLEDMIARAALVERARAAGLANSPEVRRTIEDVLIARLKEAELEPQLEAVKVAPAEIQAAYEKDAARFTQPAKAHLAILFLAADDKTDTNRLAEILARANEAHQLALSLPATEKSFGPVAADFSEDQLSRYRGGDAGWFTGDFSLAGHWPKEVIIAGLALNTNGDLSGVLRAPDGFYLVKKMDARPAVITPLASAAAGIERQLLAAKRARAGEDFKQSLRAAARVQTDSERLGKLEYPTSAVAPAASPVPPALPASP